MHDDYWRARRTPPHQPRTDRPTLAEWAIASIAERSSATRLARHSLVAEAIVSSGNLWMMKDVMSRRGEWTVKVAGTPRRTAL